MSNTAVATRNRSTAVAAPAGANPWAEAAAEGGGNFTGKYVKFSGKTGEYTAGQEADEILPGTEVIIDFDLITAGFQCWKEEEVVDRQTSTIASGNKITKADLADHGPYEKHADGSEDGWQEVHAIPFIMFEEGDDDGYLLQLSAMGGIKAARQLYGAYGKKFMQHIDDDGNYMLPVVKLDVGSYMSKIKKVGKIYFPTFEITDWISRADVADALVALGGEEPEEEPDAPEVEREEKVTRSKVAEPEPEVVAEKPAGRRAGGRAQKGEGEVVSAKHAPVDHAAEEENQDDPAEEAQDEAPVRRGRGNARAPAPEEAPAEEAPRGRGRAGSARSRSFS